jgi:hypothetical protein
MMLSAVQIAAAGTKKPTTKPSTQGSFEIKDFSFGVENPSTIKSKGSRPAPVGTAGTRRR